MTISQQDESTRLGREAAGRLRLPGPPLGKPLPSRIGSLASSVERFASSLSRPVEIRRSLRGPGSHEDSVRPPRWWTGDTPQSGEASAPPQWLRRTRRVDPRELPARQLPRAAHAVPNEQTYTPGGIVNGLHAEVARVRRMNDVVAAGSMLTSADRSRLGAATAARRRAEAVRSATPYSSAGRPASRTPSVDTAPPGSPDAGRPDGGSGTDGVAAKPAAAKAAAPTREQSPSEATAPQPSSPAPASGGAATKFAAAKAPSVAPTLHRSAAGAPSAPPASAASPASPAPPTPSAPSPVGEGPSASGSTAPSDGTATGPSDSEGPGGEGPGGADAMAAASPSPSATSSSGGPNPRASFQLRPVASRLAASVSRGEAVRMPAALRRSVAGNEVVHAAGPRLIDQSVPVTAAAGVGHEPTSATGVVRRLARGRAELARVEQQLATARRAASATATQPRADETATQPRPGETAPATVTPIRRSSIASFPGARPGAEPSPAADAAPGAARVTGPQQQDAVVRRLPATSTPAPAPAEASAEATVAAPPSPASSSSPASAESAVAASGSPAAKPASLTIARSVSAGQLSQVSGAWAAENLAGGSPSLAGLGVAMPDLLATQRVGRSAEGPMPSSFSPSTEIRPATAAITGSSASSAGKLVSSRDAAKYAVRRRAFGTPAAGAGHVPLLTPTLRRSTVESVAPQSAGTAPADASAAQQPADGARSRANAPATSSPVAPPRGAPSLRREAETPATARQAEAGTLRRTAESPSPSVQPSPSSSPSAAAAASPAAEAAAHPAPSSPSPSSPSLPPSPIRRALRPGVPGIAPPSSAPTLRRLAEARETRELRRSAGVPPTSTPRTDSPAARAGGAPRPSSTPGVPDVLRRTPAASPRALRHEHAHEAAAELRHADHVRRVAATESSQAPAPVGGSPAALRRSPNGAGPLPKPPAARAPGLGTRAPDVADSPSGAPWVSRPSALMPAPPRGAGAASPQPNELRRRFQPEPEASGGSRGSDLLQRTAHLFDDSPALEVDGPMSGISPAFGEALAQLAELQQRNAGSAVAAMPEGADLERIVDAVVDRIEERVVDELERRGRRNGRGGF